MDLPRIVRHRLYFGIEAERWREAVARVVDRANGDPEGHGAVTLDALATEFRLSAAASRALAEGMVRDGLLERLSPHAIEFEVTDRLRAYAEAPLVDPLSRLDVDVVLSHAVQLVRQFNRTAADNRYQVETLVVFGPYMNADAVLADVMVGIVLRRRPVQPKPLLGRAQQQVEGHERIRRMVTRADYVKVTFFRELADVPRPFKVLFRAQD